MTQKGLLIAAAVWLGSVGAVAGQLQHPTLLCNHTAIRYDRRLQHRLQVSGRPAALQRRLAALEPLVQHGDRIARRGAARAG